METRIDPRKLSKFFKPLGFTRYEFSEVKGFARGIAMGWKMEKVKITIIKNHFQLIHSKISTSDRS